MNVGEAAGTALANSAGIVLIVAAAMVVVAPGRCRRNVLAVVPALRRVGSTGQRRLLDATGVTTSVIGAALLVVSPSRFAAIVSVLVLLAVVIVVASLRRVSPVHGRLPRRAVRRSIRQARTLLRNGPSRRTAIGTVRTVAQREIDPVVLATVDLAWWAATIAPGSIRVGTIDIAAQTVAVPGRHGELTAVAPQTGGLTLLLVTTVGAVSGVSVRVAT